MIEIRSFRIFSEKENKLGVIVLPEFATSTRDFRVEIGTSVKALKKMSSLEAVVSSSLMLSVCRSKNAEKSLL